MLAGYLERLGSAIFRRRLADLAVALLPDKNLKHLRDIIDTLDSSSRMIFQKKKVDIQTHDETVLQQVGEGKDIMSVLRMLRLLSLFQCYIHLFEKSGQIYELVKVTSYRKRSSLVRCREFINTGVS